MGGFKKKAQDKLDKCKRRIDKAVAAEREACDARLDQQWKDTEAALQERLEVDREDELIEEIIVGSKEWREKLRL